MSKYKFNQIKTTTLYLFKSRQLYLQPQSDALSNLRLAY